MTETNDAANIPGEFWRHSMTERLVSLAGAGAGIYPVRLWLTNAERNEDPTDLSGWSPLDIEQAAGAEGLPGDLFRALCIAGFLLGTEPDEVGYTERIPGLRIRHWDEFSGGGDLG